MLNAQEIKKDFPIFETYPQLIYLDNAATTQKPKQVINAITQYYQAENANIHRGIYDLSTVATQKYEAARQKIKHYFTIPQSGEIIFTKGTTESINLVAQSFIFPNLSEGDNIVISAMEHHANLVVWQQICIQKKANLRIIPITKAGELILETLDDLLDERTKILSLIHISNTLGTINPIEAIITKAHEKNIPVLIDGAQSVLHHSINIEELDADFFVFSGHKLLGPTGIGVLYSKKQLLAQMKPYQFGGAMIRSVNFEKTTFAPIPQKFEAGTPNIVGAIGLGAALDYLAQFDKGELEAHTNILKDLATIKLLENEQVRIIGTAKEKSGIISFILEGVHPHDAATFLNEQNIAVRVGHHCTQPLMQFYGISGTLRASFTLYNTEDDVKALIRGIRACVAFFTEK